MKSDVLPFLKSGSFAAHTLWTQEIPGTKDLVPRPFVGYECLRLAAAAGAAITHDIVHNNILVHVLYMYCTCTVCGKSKGHGDKCYIGLLNVSCTNLAVQGDIPHQFAHFILVYTGTKIRGALL